MARIAVATSSPPGAEGGHLVIARGLIEALRDAGHEASLVITPDANFGHQASAYLATWRMDVGAAAGHRVDQVISLRFPSYALRHERHVCWLNHTMREYYDLWPQFITPLARRTRIKEHVKRSLNRTADRWLLTQNVQKRLTISHTVQRRLATYLGIRSEALWPPAPQRPYRCDGYGDFILAVSRLTPLKRLDLVIRALAERVARKVRLVIAGEGESGRDLEDLARSLGVRDRVVFAGRTDESMLLDNLARCRGVCFTPYDEDYGFVTVEAFASGKPVITCIDSGGPTELVTSGVSGLVTDPTPAALGVALARLMDDRAYAEKLGARGREQADAMTWREAVERLLIV